MKLCSVGIALVRGAVVVLATGILLAGCGGTAARSGASSSADAARAGGAARPGTEVSPVVWLSLHEFVERNDDLLLQAHVGMPRQDIDRLMNGLRSGSYTNPFRQQSISLGDGKRFDVLYYLTRAPLAGKTITESMLTPVILRNDRIVAIGRYPLRKLRQGECPASTAGACQ